MTPGAYLRECREAAAKSLADIALAFETTPPVSAHRRAEWLGEIERDAPLGIRTALMLHTLFPFDWDTLVALAAEQEGVEPPVLDLAVVLPGAVPADGGRSAA